MEHLRSLDVVAPGRPGADGVARRSYSVGADGVVGIEVDAALRAVVRRTGACDLIFWPGNVVLGVPLREECPSQQPSPVDVPSSASSAAAPSAAPISATAVVPEVAERARESGTPSASKTEKLGSIPGEPAETARPWRHGRGKR